jgi:hypothetical protein
MKLQYGEWGLKNPSLHSHYQNVYVLIVKLKSKKCTQKALAKKTIFPIENLPKPQKICFLDNTFMSALFTNFNCTFLKSV